LSASGDRQVEHLVLGIGFRLNESSGLEASADVTQGNCQFFKFCPQASIGVGDPGAMQWAMAHVASSLKFMSESVPEISEGLAACSRDKSPEA
jgi:hypothetical protein